MKKISIHCFLFVFVCIAFSCSNNSNKSREEQIIEFRNELTSEDTVTMLRLCDDAMEMLKNKQIDQVIASLSLYDDSTKEILPLSETAQKRYARMFRQFPVHQYTRNYYSFMLEGCNDVKYDVVFATAEQTGTGKPATTTFMFNPIKINNEWKLCVKTANDSIDIEKQ